MKKITLLLSFIACVMVAQGQTNLVVNPGFETWTSGTAPDGWTLGNTAYAAVAQNTTLFNEGTKSFQVLPVASNGGTYSVSQSISITGGKTYILSMSYYIETGDGTDARIWCNFKTGTTYFAEADLVATGLYPKLRGPGAANSSGSEYFPDVKGTWNTYTIEFTAPANADGFDFQFRTYKSPAKVSWDNMSLVEKSTSGTTNPAENTFKAIVSGKNLFVNNVDNSSTVEIFSALGNKVQTSKLENGSVLLNNLPKGMYIVRVGKQTQKIML